MVDFPTRLYKQGLRRQLMQIMRQSSRKIIIIASCCFFATVSFLFKAQYIVDSTQSIPADSLDYVHEVLDNKSAATTLKYSKEKLLSSSADSALQLQPHLRNSSIKEDIIANDRTGREVNNLYWDELSDGEQVAAQELGYSQDSWDNDKPTALASKRWIGLTSEQRTAAKVLGYNRQKWIKQKKQTNSPPSANTAPQKTHSMITRPKDGPPLFNLPRNQTLCKLNNFSVVCFNTTRNTSIESYPLFAEYYTDGDGTRVLRQSIPQRRPIATSWFQPSVKKFCGNLSNEPCANLGDELGPMLLLKLSGAKYIESRYDGMDVVIIGSVLNFIVQKYNDTVVRVGNYYNVSVWGTGTKWTPTGVCFDYRAVRGPLTRSKLLTRGCNVPEVFGDAALLFPYIYKPKKLSLPVANLCLVPHLGDLAENFPWWSELNGTSLIPRFTHFDHRTNNQTVRVIDIRTPDAAEFIDTMMTCKLVASASLHGMILAEAYNLTWSWIRLRDKSEQPFKYNDFFESVGISKGDVKPLQLKPKDPVDKIIEHTMKLKIRGPSLFDPVKLLDACPFCDAKIVKSIKASIETRSR